MIKNKREIKKRIKTVVNFRIKQLNRGTKINRQGYQSVLDILQSGKDVYFLTDGDSDVLVRDIAITQKEFLEILVDNSNLSLKIEVLS